MEVSTGEMLRRIESVEARLDGHYVLSVVYKRDVAEMKSDLHELKESSKWATRLIVTQFVAAFVGLVVWLVTTT